MSGFLPVNPWNCWWSNGSRDHTVEVAKSWRPQPGLVMRYLHVPTPGKGYAYNAGIKAAKGDILLFTDDDVRLPENWIEGMIWPIESGCADAVAGGVRIAPHLMRPWMTPKIQRMLSSTIGRPINSPWSFIGANMCFHRRVLSAISRIDESIGPGTRYGYAEESLFAFQLVESGYNLITEFDVEVEHHFPLARLRACSMLRIAFHMGMSFAYIDWHWRQRGPDSFRKALLWQSIRLVPLIPRMLFLSMCKKEKSIRESELAMAEKFAYLIQYNRETRRAQNYQMRGRVKLRGH